MWGLLRSIFGMGTPIPSVEDILLSDAVCETSENLELVFCELDRRLMFNAVVETAVVGMRREMMSFLACTLGLNWASIT